jgi:hypothetical protein
MRWSYSRITCFEDCKYKWFLKYIKEETPVKKYFSEYGTFMHKIIEMYLTNQLKKNELSEYYILNFKNNVTPKPPNNKISLNYFNQGLDYLDNIEFPHTNILGVEEEVLFKIGDKDFIGYIDVVSNDDEICITDNKSRDLKERKGKKKPLKSDLELDDYLRQLYLYSIPVYEKYNKYPKYLEFNCFRTKIFIKEEFNPKTFEDTKIWAINAIQKITNNEEWKPSLDYWKCNHLCDMSENCEYKSLL